MRNLTIEEAKAQADDWKAQREDHDRQPKASYFADCSPHELIAMWETDRRKDGRKLNQYEFGCLVEAWCQCFGCHPPFDGQASKPVASERANPDPMPNDDTMLRMPEVVRLTGMSKSTIKRMVISGAFPKPLRLGIRSKGWPASEVKHFMALLAEQRSRPRQ